MSLRVTLVQEYPDKPYFTGSDVIGNVVCAFNEPKRFKSISIKFVGSSRVHWTERRSSGSGRRRRTRTISYTSTEVYVDQTHCLWNKEQSLDGNFPPGEHCFPFTFSIPLTAPSAFEGTVGRIRYTLQARISTGLFKFDHTVDVIIPVQQLVTITDPGLLQPHRQEAQKVVCCLCCASGPVILSVAVPKTGFYIGESFSSHVSIENGSRSSITLNAIISQNVFYSAQGKQRRSQKSLISIGSDAIESQATREWDPIIQIPPTDIVQENCCQNIKVHYVLIVTAQIPLALNLSTKVPLKLGNMQQNDADNPSIQPEPLLAAQSCTTSPPTAPVSWTTFDPPTSEKSLADISTPP